MFQTAGPEFRLHTQCGAEIYSDDPNQAFLGGNEREEVRKKGKVQIPGTWYNRHETNKIFKAHI